MEFRYLGTAAAEGWPAVFCNCEYCLKAKKLGGKNIRTRSQSIINDDLLIDFPSDTYAHALFNRLDLSAVKWCVVTHAHIDHFVPTDLFFRADSCYAHNLTSPDMTVVCNQAVADRLEKIIGAFPDESPRLGIKVEIIPLYESRKYGRYTVTALRANHSYGEEAHIYLISDGERTLLYLHDTGMLYDDVWDYLEKNKIKADFVSYDCTFVALPSGGGHLGLDSCVTVRDMLLEKGIIDSGTVNCINHFSHNGKLVHDELVPVAADLGFLTAYDGMALTI